MDDPTSLSHIFDSTTGRLENLEQLTTTGRQLAVTIVHLLLQGQDENSKKTLAPTVRWLLENRNMFKAHKATLYRYLHPYSNEHEFKSPAMISPSTTKKVTKEHIQKVHNQCGVHTLNFSTIAKMLKVDSQVLKNTLADLRGTGVQPQKTGPCVFCNWVNLDQNQFDGSLAPPNVSTSTPKSSRRPSLYPQMASIGTPTATNSSTSNLTPNRELNLLQLYLLEQIKLVELSLIKLSSGQDNFEVNHW